MENDDRYNQQHGGKRFRPFRRQGEPPVTASAADLLIRIMTAETRDLERNVE